MPTAIDPLENPVWAALHTGHAAVAQGAHALLRYPVDIAPFAAIASDAEPLSPETLDQAIASGDHVYFVGCTPSLPASWSGERGPNILQMIFAAHPSEPPPAPPGSMSLSASMVLRELGAADVPAMLALTGLVYPEYFRARTRELGRYIGLFDGDTLVAMGGERFRLARHVELSAICTHPAHLGRGHARTIIANLVASVVDRGLTPFLHLSVENTRAHALYRRAGFTERSELRMVRVSPRIA